LRSVDGQHQCGEGGDFELLSEISGLTVNREPDIVDH
jgi:hypothetical protein